eukprot:CAMPEP_0179137438 /NCGR_PEP_ID=MMETSP0796-20121207/65564_1 /TAXON_ID=73915 /ORGANISM="Pyrodinium bahamense, Strain pbaha01" /LENGTH=51 /DNA_ID=CAMNT_0020836617 /DNA_START=64 /DNA_END=216 /DNA_ORIENTATION=-
MTTARLAPAQKIQRESIRPHAPREVKSLKWCKAVGGHSDAPETLPGAPEDG